MGLEKETPPLMSAQVRVFRSLGHRPAQRVYRQSWTGQLLADFETAAHGQQCRLFILAARTSGHYVAVRTSVENQTDFSIDYFPCKIVLKISNNGFLPILRTALVVRLEALHEAVPLVIIQHRIKQYIRVFGASCP